jgi:predicted RND superfamily exporter protein
MLFSAAFIAGGISTVLGSGSENLIQSDTYALGRAEIAQIMDIYAMKMAGVFMITTSTIALKTQIFTRWMAVLGYILALVLLLSVGTIRWIPLVFPIWVLVISVYILTQNLHGQSEAAAQAEGAVSAVGPIL